MDEIEYVTIPKRHWLRTSDALDETIRERDTFKRNLRNALIHAKAWKAACRGIWQDREKVHEQCDQYQREVAWQAERAGRAEAELAKADAKWEREWSAQRERAEKAEAEGERLRERMNEHERRLGKAFDEIHEILGTADLSEAVEMVRTLKQQRDLAVVRAKFLEGVERLYHQAKAELAALREQS